MIKNTKSNNCPNAEIEKFWIKKLNPFPKIPVLAVSKAGIRHLWYLCLVLLSPALLSLPLLTVRSLSCNDMCKWLILISIHINAEDRYFFMRWLSVSCHKIRLRLYQNKQHMLGKA